MKRKWVWVTRDISEGRLCAIWSGKRKPIFDQIEGVWLLPKANLIIVCDSFLAKHTGVKIKPGECVKVEFSGKIVEG